MHVIWVMLRTLNVNENDNIIQQKSIPVARVKKLLRSEEHAVSSGVTASLTSGVSAATTALPLAASTTAISGGLFHNIGVSTTNIAIPPAAGTTAISGGFLPNSGSSTTYRALPLAAGTTAISGGFFHNIGVSAASRALPPAASTTASSSGFSNSSTSGGLLPNSGSSTTSSAIPAAYPHFPPHVYHRHAFHLFPNGGRRGNQKLRASVLNFVVNGRRPVAETGRYFYHWSTI